MEIVFSNHALYQMAERTIAKGDVIQTVRKPFAIAKQSERRYRAVRMILRNRRRYLLVVVVDIAEAVHEVVTVFITRKFHKYP